MRRHPTAFPAKAEDWHAARRGRFPPNPRVVRLAALTGSMPIPASLFRDEGTRFRPQLVGGPGVPIDVRQRPNLASGKPSKNRRPNRGFMTHPTKTSNHFIFA